METLRTASALLAAVLLGLTAGALLAEGAIFVPFWRSLPPHEFLAWYRRHAALLQNFFGPLEVAATLTTIVAAAVSWTSPGGISRLLVLACLLAVAVLAVFPIYFQKANASFAAGTIAEDRVPGELRRWSAWHWIRTVIATAAFISALASPMV